MLWGRAEYLRRTADFAMPTKLTIYHGFGRWKKIDCPIDWWIVLFSRFATVFIFVSVLYADVWITKEFKWQQRIPTFFTNEARTVKSKRFQTRHESSDNSNN